jgi:hypothetical protein
MSTLPRDVRISTIYEIGVKIDDYLDAAKSETLKREGAQAAYANCATNLTTLIALLDRESSKTPENEAHVPYAKSWIKKCILMCENLAKQARELTANAKGAEKQTSTFVALLKQMHDLEEIKKQRETVPLAVEALPVAPAVISAAPAVLDAPAVNPPRPAVRRRTIKEERLAQAAANAAAKPPIKAPAAVVVKPETKPAIKAEPKAAPKKRGRPPKRRA